MTDIRPTDWTTVKCAADFLRVSTTTIYRWCELDYLEHRHAGPIVSSATPRRRVQIRVSCLRRVKREWSLGPTVSV